MDQYRIIGAGEPDERSAASRVARVMLVLITIGALGLLAPTHGRAASWETVKTFAPLVQPPPNPPQWPEDVQLGGVGGIAVNETGAGNVAPGTIYTVGLSSSEWHAARFSPNGAFELAWKGIGEPCGPRAPSPSACPAIPTGSASGIDIAVDQLTGNLFVFYSGETPRRVREYKPDGTGPIAEFGEFEPGGTVATSPEKIHSSPFAENIAVGPEHTVYVYDVDANFFARLMVFKPCVPGVVTSYCYAGRSSDIGNGSYPGPIRPMTDKAGDIFSSSETSILEYDPAHPSSPICSFNLQSGGITSATVDPATGAVFYYTVKPEKVIHQLEPCNAEGKFIESKAANPPVAPVPQRGNIEAMAFNPTQKFGITEGTGDLTAGSEVVVNVKTTSGIFSVGQTVEGIGIAANATITEVGTGTIKLSAPASVTGGAASLLGVSPGASRERAAGILIAGAPQACPNGVQCPPGAEGQSALGYMFAPQLHLEPVVTSESVTKVGVTSATLNATVDPKGSSATATFQYISEAAYLQNPSSDRFAGAISAPPGGTPVGNSQLASVTVSGLSPDTAYRYRVEATNANGTVNGQPEGFRTLGNAAVGLPDNRAFELVSPVQKNGGEVLPGTPNLASCGSECKPGLAAHRFPVEATPDGEAIAYQAQPFSLNDGPVEYNEYVSRRSASGWQTDGLGPPLIGNASGILFEVFGLDANLSRAATYATNGLLAQEAPDGYRNLFQQVVGNPLALEPLLREAPPKRSNSGTNVFQMRFAGASTDLTRVFFEANDALTAGSPVAPAAKSGAASEFNLYEWRDGNLRLVNVQPGNAATNPGASFGSGFQLADESNPSADFTHAISSDGSHVFWSSKAGQVYVRVSNGESEDGETREAPDHVGKFVSASADGSQAILSDGKIYNVETGAITDITGGHGGFEGVAGQSEDLSTVYFVDTAILNTSPNAAGAVAESGKPNLYVWRNGAVVFVATLRSGDNGALGVWHASASQRYAEASPDGRWFAFNSTAPLTGANTIGACTFDPSLQKYVGSVPCEEVYLYDSATESLICPSCNPSGAHPLGGSFVRTLKGAQGYLKQPRYLTDQGRLYFDSRDSLAAADTNNGVEDVYQYEPAGVGNCGSEGGCVSLLSTGRSSFDSNFLAADAMGNNVFFTTRDRLVPADQDSLIDLYDARVDGGIAADQAAQRPECSGEGCQSSQASTPTELSPSSSAVEGSGNVKPAKKNQKKDKHKHKKHKHKSSKKKAGKKAKRGQGSHK